MFRSRLAVSASRKGEINRYIFRATWREISPVPIRGRISRRLRNGAGQLYAGKRASSWTIAASTHKQHRVTLTTTGASRCRAIIIFHYSSKTVHQRSSRGLPSRIVHDTAIASTRGVNYVPSYRVTLALEISRGSRTKTGRESSTLDLSPLPFLRTVCSPTGRFSFLKIATLYRETQI